MRREVATGLATRSSVRVEIWTRPLEAGDNFFVLPMGRLRLCLLGPTALVIVDADASSPRPAAGVAHGFPWSHGPSQRLVNDQ